MRIFRNRTLNLTAGILGVIAVIAGVLWVLDLSLAARAESRLSRAIAESAQLDNSPRVHAGGSIFTTSLFTGELDSVSIEMLDVDVPGVGMVNATSEVQAVQVSPEQLLRGDLEGTTAELFSRTLRLDGVALGAQLGITDLDIAHPFDVSPSGGRAAEAVLTGTPPGATEPVSVLATLRLLGPEFRLTPVELVDAPAGTQLGDVEGAFSWRVDTRQLPLADRAMSAYLAGGSIHLQSQARNVTLSTRELSPLAAPEEDSGAQTP